MPFSVPDYVVDTSVVVKWYVERGEENARRALELLETWDDGRCTLRAPELLVFELANALSSERRLKPSEVSEALDRFRSLGLNLEVLRWHALAKAVEIAVGCGTTIYDSYFLALALQSDSILVTADEDFLRKVRSYPGVISLSQFPLPG